MAADNTLLRLALTEKKCPCRPPSYGCNECCTILHDYQHGIWCEHCKGTGRVPLMPGLRKKCDCPTVTLIRVDPDYSEKEITPCNSRCNGQHGRVCKCQGRGWNVTTNAETIARGLWPLLQTLPDSTDDNDKFVLLMNLVEDYAQHWLNGRFNEAVQSAALALEEAGLLEKETP